MTAVRLPDGSVWVHSPIPLETSRADVDALGEVRHIVLPNLYHHLFASEWAEAYPKAIVHAPRRLRRKRADLRIDADLSETPHSEWGGALVPLHIDGCALDETVFVHPATRTLVSSDLTESFATSDHLPTRLYLKAAGLENRIGWSRFLRFMYRDHDAARRSIDRLLEHDFERIVVAHGRPIESDARQAIVQTFCFLRA